MIPFIDLKTQYARIKDEVLAGVGAVLEHGQYIMGPEVKELEKCLADFTGAKQVISCASGTDALLMPLLAKGIGPGDVVLTTPFTFIATAEVISLLGATPVFVDIDPDTFNIDPAKLELTLQAIRANDPQLAPLPRNLMPGAAAKGVIPVDLFGLPADFDRINRIAAREGLFVLEDAAQGFGGVYKGRMAGSLGHAGAVSFFPAKPLGCYGDGGAIVTDDLELADVLRSIRVHGQGSEKYENVRIGLNARLDTIQAAILLPKVKIFPHELAERQRVAERYTELLQKTTPLITTPHIPDGTQSAWAQYSILCENRDALSSALKGKGIPTMVYYPRPLHLQKAYSGLGYREGDFPTAEKICRSILSLPMHPYLQDDQIQLIAKAVLDFSLS